MGGPALKEGVKEGDGPRSANLTAYGLKGWAAARSKEDGERLTT